MKYSHALTASIFALSIAIPGVSFAQARNSEPLPPPGQEVSLENFDSYIGELDSQIRERLGQLSPAGESEGTDGLDRPNTDSYASDLEILSKVQRDTKVLQAMLAKAQLARQVWAEVHSNPTEEYEQRIREMQDQLNLANEEMRSVQMEFEIERDEMQREQEQLRQRYQEAESRASSLQSQLANRGMGGGSNGSPSQINPKISYIVSSGPRKYAVFSFPDGSRVEGSPGDNIGTGLVIDSIEGDRVTANRNGTKVWLEKGSYEPASGNSRQNLSGPTSYSPDPIIDDVASYANN